MKEMTLKLFLTTALLFSSLIAVCQTTHFSPQLLIGNRSTAYLQVVKHKVNSRLSFNNLTYVDAEHNSDKSTIYFVRNTGSLFLTNRLYFNLAIGVKNPGKFATGSFQYRYNHKNFFASYSVGTTLQETFTLEQSLSVRYSHFIKNQLKAYYSLLIISNTTYTDFTRGIQQLRLGIAKKHTAMGFGANYDQFNNATKTLLNLGVFISHTIKSKQ